MALSRLRHPLLSRAPSLFKLRPLSTSCRPLTRASNAGNSLVEGDGTMLRHLSLSMASGIHDSLLMLKMPSGVRCFSSAEVPSHTVLEMPALSPTMNQGNISKWRKKEGDKIEVGDVICEIETDKATLEFECLEEGYLAKILAPEGSKDVPVGRPIAITVEDPDDIPNVPESVTGSPMVKEDKSSNQDSGSKENAQKTSSTAISSAELPPHIVLEMPALSPTMNQGNIAKWRKKEGEKIQVGDVICEIETDKATLEFESLEEGFLAKILAPEGSKDVLVGQPIAITVEDPDDLKNVQSIVTVGSAGEEEKPTHQAVGRNDSAPKKGFTRISPSAKLLIAEFDLDVSSLKASGPRGTLLKGDVLAAIKSGVRSSGPSSSSKVKIDASPRTHVQISHMQSSEAKSSLQHSDIYEDLPNSQIRKVIARRLLESKQNIPHLYLSSDVVLDPLLAFRKQLKDQHDVKVSVNDIVIKAVAVALRNVPEANAYWDAKNGEIIQCNTIDISVAVATEKGLMTPIVRNADQKTISQISSEIKELAEKARAGKLSPNEFQGGTFSISNLGMFPVDHFCAIINPPQACILAIGRGIKVVKPVFDNHGNEKPAVITKMNLTLSADHRVFDGKVAGAFLSALQLNFSDIRRLML